MDLEEYNKIKDYNYSQYCDYLHKKYGAPQGSYFLTPTCKSKNQKITRGNEGLFLHHIMECKTDLLCDKEKATKFPFEWQEGKNLVYCDLLEHLLLHIMIYEETFATNCRQTGIGGVINWIVPELNDVYSGFISEQKWRIVAHDKIRNELNLYLELIKRFYICDVVNLFYCRSYDFENDKIIECQNEYNENSFHILFSSFNSGFGLWDNNKNNFIYNEIEKVKNIQITKKDITKVSNKDDTLRHYYVEIPKLQIGDKVIHNLYGEGTVIEINDNQATISFNDRNKNIDYPFEFEFEIMTLKN